jgi:hypothetical protein
MEIRDPRDLSWLEDLDDRMVSTGFKNLIYLDWEFSEADYLGRPIKDLPKVAKSLFNKHISWLQKYVQEGNAGDDLCYCLSDILTYALDEVEEAFGLRLSSKQANSIELTVHREMIEGISIDKDTFWKRDHYAEYQDMINESNARYKKLGIEFDRIDIWFIGSPYTDYSLKSTDLHYFECIGRMYEDDLDRGDPLTDNTYTLVYIVFSDPRKSLRTTYALRTQMLAAVVDDPESLEEYITSVYNLDSSANNYEDKLDKVYAKWEEVLKNTPDGTPIKIKGISDKTLKTMDKKRMELGEEVFDRYDLLKYIK